VIWNEKIECMPPEELAELQLKRLRNLVKYISERSSFYQRRLQETGVSYQDVRELADLIKLPFTHKTDLRDNYPFGMFCVPSSEIAEIHASSGTTGNPTVVGYTRNDIKLWSVVMARTLTIATA